MDVWAPRFCEGAGVSGAREGLPGGRSKKWETACEERMWRVAENRQVAELRSSWGRQRGHIAWEPDLEAPTIT
jgi:hypothetical protein